MGVPMHVRKCPTFGFERSQEIETMIGCRRWIEEKILASNFQRWLNAIPSDTEVDPPFFVESHGGTQTIQLKIRKREWLVLKTDKKDLLFLRVFDRITSVFWSNRSI